MPGKEQGPPSSELTSNQLEAWRSKLSNFLDTQLPALLRNQKARISFLSQSPPPGNIRRIIPYSDLGSFNYDFISITHDTVIREMIPGRFRHRAPRWQVAIALNFGEQLPFHLSDEDRQNKLETIIDLVHAFALKELRLIGETPNLEHPTNDGPHGLRLTYTIEFKFKPNLSDNLPLQ